MTARYSKVVVEPKLIQRPIDEEKQNLYMLFSCKGGR